MSSSGIWCRVALVSIDVSEECIASIMRVKRIIVPGTALTVTGNRSTLRRNSNCRRKEANEWDTKEIFSS
jgi:hypothetical protein